MKLFVYEDVCEFNNYNIFQSNIRGKFADEFVAKYPHLLEGNRSCGGR